MTPDTVLEITQGALKMAALIASVPLLSALVVGVVVGWLVLSWGRCWGCDGAVGVGMGWLGL